MIERISEQLGSFVYRWNDRRDVSREVLVFAIQSMLTIILTIACSLMTGYILNALPETTIVLVAMAILRNLTGGYHFRSQTACILLSSFVVVAIPHIPLPDLLIHPVTLVAMLLIAVYAPRDLKETTRLSSKRLMSMKLAAILVVGLNLFIGSSLLALSFIAQGLTLISFKRKRVKA